MEKTLNQYDAVSHSVEKEEKEVQEEEDKNLEEYSQRYIYRFDDPLVQDSGCVHVTDNRIIVQFPVKPDHTQSFKPMHQVQLYLNKHIIFYSEWLPILTLQDYAKFKTMFQQIWHEYSTLTQHYYWFSSSFGPLMHNELVTIFNKPSYYLSCFETNHITSLELETKVTKVTKLPSSQTLPIHVQFYFGSHLVFCSESQLQNLDAKTLHFVLSFILQKLMN